MSLDGSEHVLVTPRDHLGDLLGFQGFRPVCREDRGAVLDEILERSFFLPRDEQLEHGDHGLTFKQIIAYGCVVHRDRVFAFRRPSKGGDARLQARYSIGAGGHTNPVDSPTGGLNRPGSECLAQCMSRELREELDVRGLSTHMIGLLNDDGNDIGKRHVGVVYLCRVGDERVMPRRAEIEPLGWFGASELAAEVRPWEGWSQILVESIGDVLGQRNSPPRSARTATG